MLSRRQLSFPSERLTNLFPPSLPLLPVDCATEATKLARASCAPLRGIFFERGGGAAVYGSATECSQLNGALDKMLQGADIPAGCCKDARVFASAGCPCSPEVAELITGLRVLPPGVDASLTVSGIINLLQASKCATDAFGGPILNSCTSSTGCAPVTA